MKIARQPGQYRKSKVLEISAVMVPEWRNPIKTEVTMWPFAAFGRQGFLRSKDNIYEVTVVSEKLIMAGDGHISLLPVATIFERSVRSYLQPEITTWCDQWSHYLRG